MKLTLFLQSGNGGGIGIGNGNGFINSISTTNPNSGRAGCDSGISSAIPNGSRARIPDSSGGNIRVSSGIDGGSIPNGSNTSTGITRSPSSRARFLRFAVFTL